MGKKHTEEAVIPILLRKGIIVKEKDYDETGQEIILKEIGIPLNVHPGLKILGKLDYMRKMGWRVLKMEQMTDSIKPQKKSKREQSQEKDTNRKRIKFNKSKIN